MHTWIIKLYPLNKFRERISKQQCFNIHRERTNKRVCITMLQPHSINSNIIDCCVVGNIIIYTQSVRNHLELHVRKSLQSMAIYMSIKKKRKKQKIKQKYSAIHKTTQKHIHIHEILICVSSCSCSFLGTFVTLDVWNLPHFPGKFPEMLHSFLKLVWMLHWLS